MWAWARVAGARRHAVLARASSSAAREAVGPGAQPAAHPAVAGRRLAQVSDLRVAQHRRWWWSARGHDVIAQLCDFDSPPVHAIAARLRVAEHPPNLSQKTRVAGIAL